MKSSISFIFIVICTVVLAAQQSQAKKGCNAYGHACYGGHGKRSLGSLANAAGIGHVVEQAEMHPDSVLQVLPNDAAILTDGIYDSYPKYHLIRIVKSWFGNHGRPMPISDRTNEPDYAISGETYNKENSNLFN